MCAGVLDLHNGGDALLKGEKMKNTAQKKLMVLVLSGVMVVAMATSGAAGAATKVSEQAKVTAAVTSNIQSLTNKYPFVLGDLVLIKYMEAEAIENSGNYCAAYLAQIALSSPDAAEAAGVLNFGSSWPKDVASYSGALRGLIEGAFVDGIFAMAGPGASSVVVNEVLDSTLDGSAAGGFAAWSRAEITSELNSETLAYVPSLVNDTSFWSGVTQWAANWSLSNDGGEWRSALWIADETMATFMVNTPEGSGYLRVLSICPA